MLKAATFYLGDFLAMLLVKSHKKDWRKTLSVVMNISSEIKATKHQLRLIGEDKQKPQNKSSSYSTGFKKIEKINATATQPQRNRNATF